MTSGIPAWFRPVALATHFRGLPSGEVAACATRDGQATILTVGQSIACAARVNGRSDRGTALLETEEVIFRGDATRARVPFAAMRSVDVKKGWLLVVHAEGSLDLDLGARAATWQERIRSPKGLVAKLGIKSGARVAIVGVGDAPALAADLGALGATVREGAPRGEVEVILLRVAKDAELARVKTLATKLTPDGALWIVRPKGKDGVAEGAVFEAGRGAGLVDVKVVKWSETDTGLKFVVRKEERGARGASRAARVSAPRKASATKRTARKQARA